MVDLRPYEKLHSIQMLKGIIRRWWRVELAFADATGYVLDHAEGRLAPPNNDFCRLALSSQEGFRRCNESLREVRDRLRTLAHSPAAKGGRRALVHECHLGFDLVGCPIVLDGELAGLLFVGGARRTPLEPAAEAELHARVRALGVALPPPLGDRRGERSEVSEANHPRRSVERSEARPGDGRAGHAALHQMPAAAPAAPPIPELPPAELARLCDLLEFGADEIQAFHAEQKKRERELTSIRQEIGERYRFESIVGTSRAMQDVFRLLEKIIESESTVLIQGESGTGKELVARAIHYNGPRGKKAFVVQNCSAFNDNLLESALFGHTRGSFTGAIKDQKGLFEVADGGSFFLDEVGDMSPALQVKLLRVLQEGTFTPVGGTDTREVDVRVIAATHKDLHALVKKGEFREDLYYRINVIKIQIPPLRERIDDLDVLVDHFLRKHWRRRPGHHRERPPPVAADARAVMRRYPWPGNIRELENEIERLLVLGGDLEELPEDLLSSRLREAAGELPAAARPGARVEPGGTLRTAVEALERDLIHQGLIRTHWNKSVLAKELGISRSNLIAKVERYRLDKKTD